MNLKKIACGALGAALLLSATACSAVPAKDAGDASTSQLAAQAEKSPKYVFLFIGDGMSYPQFQAASDYLGALADKDYVKALPSNSYEDRAGAVLGGPKALNFMDFDVAGSAVTYDSCSFAPDSASTATSIATGYKTYSGMINVDTTGSTSYETIAEKLHSQKGWKVGIITSVNLNHATPAAFYAHQPSRNNYYEIGEEMLNSGFEYFAGGGLKKVTGPDKDKTSLYDLAAVAGYKVTYTQADAEAVTAFALNQLSRQTNGASFKAENVSGYIDTFSSILQTVSLLITAIGGIGLLVGGIGVMNSMTAAVESRRKEIGIYLAIGAQKKDIIGSYLMEAVIVCLLGGLTGGLLGWGLLFAGEKLLGIPVQFHWGYLLLAEGAAGFCGILFGILPARKAAEHFDKIRAHFDYLSALRCEYLIPAVQRARERGVGRDFAQ